MSESIHEACGVFAISGNEEASHHTYLGLYALQHRGQESAGIVTAEGEQPRAHIGMGLVADVFDESTMEKLKGDRAIGHVRYSTTGSSDLVNAQPILCEYRRGWVAVAHNGNLINTMSLRCDLEAKGSIFRTTTDSEILIHLLARSPHTDFLKALEDSLLQLRGAYSMVIMNDQYVIGLRDPLGIRPLSLGKLKDAYIFCSETNALEIIGAEYIRTVEPGEMVIISKDRIESRFFAVSPKKAQCVFELVYFARPDSHVFGQEVHPARENLGRVLYRECPTEADAVIPIPDSSVCSALGYALESGIALQQGIIRSHYIGRTFIEPSQSIRDFGAKIKYSPVRAVLNGKRIIVVDDSIVRGTTMRKIVKMLRKAGAAEIHLRIASPVWIEPCFYGIDTPHRNKLIGATHNLEEIKKHLRVDSLYYLSIEGLLKAVGGTHEKFCTACFSGNYPLQWNGHVGAEADKKIVDAEKKLVRVDLEPVEGVLSEY
ncbi:MAG: amidophosphoribosyltransferase [Candidatus Omnitrophota bacterium]|jgi:amidophosphoribosyltransferase|nr:MAG: amidophosphoribosyltransferase [Candidatus Omnitrophota bacterium]